MSDLKSRVLFWLREQREMNGAGRCYGLDEIAKASQCTEKELLDDDLGVGVLRDLRDAGSVAITHDRSCAFAIGGQMEW